MAEIEGRPVGIKGSGMSLPKKKLSNADLEKIVDTADEWIVGRTGMHSRYVLSEGESNSSLAASASLDALKDSGVEPGDVDMVIVGTNSPDTLFPGVGPTVQHLIGAQRAGGMDLQAGCPGGLFALAVAGGGIASGVWKNVVVAASEAMSRLVDWEDRGTCILFGDGAAAVVVGEWSDGMPRLTHVDMKADGGRGDLITIPGGMAAEPATEETVRARRHFMKMNGNEVFKFVNRKIPEYLENFCLSCGITTSDVDWWIFHQANIRIWEGVFRRMGVSMERAVINLDRYGNTSAASIMIGLHEALADGLIEPGQRIVLTSFGAGMTYGAAMIES
jgi:3-oxoacyl-[acyl-carrier-protein] synthase-3